MNNLKDIHNYNEALKNDPDVVYQDFNEQFEGYTQLRLAFLNFIKRCLSGFQ